MSKNAAIVARIVEHNTGGQNLPTIDRDHIGVIAASHGRFDGDLDDAIAERPLMKDTSKSRMVSTKRPRKCGI